MARGPEWVGWRGPVQNEQWYFDLLKHFQIDLNQFGQKKVLQT
jgi:hypothetical protein